MGNLASDFNDPFEPARSLQLNNRYWKAETFQNLDALRAAEYDIEHLRLASLRRSLAPVKALIDAKWHYKFISRLVYSIVYRVVFEPIRFNLKLSDEFVKANSYTGTEPQARYTDVHRTEELKYLVSLARTVYRDHYGADFMSSGFEVRYVNAKNPISAGRVTKFGDTSDFHVDAGKDFTCIIYLSPVTRDSGCFSYYDGTNRVRKSHVLRALHQVVHLDMGLSTPEEVSPLPLELRGGMNIGDYLDDDKRERLRAARVDVMGGVGDGIIFNGFDLLHRGGHPLAGERTAVFIGTMGHVRTRVKKAAYDMLAYLWL